MARTKRWSKFYITHHDVKKINPELTVDQCNELLEEMQGLIHERLCELSNEILAGAIIERDLSNE